MKAAVLGAHGDPPAYADHAAPQAPPGGALVRVTAAPLVPLDLLCASGTSYFGPPSLPYVPGVQGVGVVETSDRLEPGTRVWFATSAGMRSGDGGLAELCAVTADDLVVLDTAAPDAEVAALGLSAVAAWMSLTWRAGLRVGERVLVLGAGGAVGQVATGAARALGAKRVVGVCRAGASAERAGVHGAHAVVELPGSPDADGLAESLRTALGGTADVVVDPVFGWVATAATRVMAPGGRLVNLGGSAGDDAPLSSAVLRGGDLSLLGYTNNSLTAEQRAEALAAVLRLAESGHLGVEHDVQPLSSVAEVWTALAAGELTRRQVLVP